MSYSNYGSSRYGSSGYGSYGCGSRRSGGSSYSSTGSTYSRRPNSGPYGLLSSVSSSYLSPNSSPRSSLASSLPLGFNTCVSPRNSKSYDSPSLGQGSVSSYKSVSPEFEKHSREFGGYKLTSSKSSTSVASDISDSSLSGVVCEKLRQAYGSSSCPDISSDTTSLCETLSRHSSLSSGKDSLDDETDLNYRKLYEEMKKENERLKAFEKENEQLHEALKKAEDELERAKKLIKKMSESNNSRNSISETEKKERRALERKLSEMEEEVKNIAKLKTENEKLKAENRALSRVVCKLSK